MRSRPTEPTPNDGTRGPAGGPARTTGAWVPWPTAEAMFGLQLRPPSLWQVLHAVVLTSARYGGRDARLGIADLAQMTGLSHRTIKGALTKLVELRILSRVGRYRRLRVNLPGMGPVGGAGLSAPPADASGKTRSASKIAPPRGNVGCTSPNSIYVSLLRERDTGGTFSAKQMNLIGNVFVESTELLGSDITALSMPDREAASLGLEPLVSYGDAFASIARTGDRARANGYTRAVLALRRDERVQGRELVFVPEA